MKKIGFFIFVMMVLAGLCSEASAQLVLDIFKKPLPKITFLPDGEFIDKTNFFEEFPAGAQHLSYEVRVPKNWSEVDNVSLGSLAVDSRVMSTLSKYAGPVVTGIRHYMTVQVIGLSYQMTAKNWSMRHILENSYTLQGMKAHDDRNVELLYIFVVDNVSYVVRAVVKINGDNLVFVQHFLPLEEWHDHKIMQAQILDSFKLKFESDENIEGTLVHDFLDISRVDYPDSWTLKSRAIPSLDRMEVELLSLTDKYTGEGSSKILTGRISLEMVSVYATEGIDKEMEGFQEVLVRRGLFVQDELDDGFGFLFEDSDILSETHVFEMIDKNRGLRSYEYWVTIMAYGNYYYFVTLLTPSRDDDFFKWSRNIETYKFVSEHFKPQKRKPKSGD